VSPRILIVDDEPSLVSGLSYALERDGFDVEVATDGEGAVDMALSRNLDLIILDVMLPKLSGTDACRRIRAASDVPIIMLTARDSERDLVNGLEVGADDYVTKPFSSAELLSRISALLRRRTIDRGASGHVSLKVGDITIDLLADTVTVEGRGVGLTPSEFKVICLLASAPDSVFSRRQIMEHLWGSTHIGDEHTCEVHISALRRKIERDPGAHERLITVRGEGYLLTAREQRSP
jgi:two-component system response regulator RegX3